MKMNLSSLGFNKSSDPNLKIKGDDDQKIIGIHSCWNAKIWWTDSHTLHATFTTNILSCIQIKKSTILSLDSGYLVFYLSNHGELYYTRDLQSSILLRSNVKDYASTRNELCLAFNKELCTFSMIETGMSLELQLIETLNQQITKLASGTFHILALSLDGFQVFVYGSNLHGQLGLGSVVAQPYSWTPLDALCGIKILDIAAGDLHSLFLTEFGEVYACGNNEYCQIGSPLSVTGYPMPVLEVSFPRDTKLFAGARHSIIFEGTIVYASGWNKYNQIQEGLGLLVKGFIKLETPVKSVLNTSEWNTFVVSYSP